MDPRAWQKTDYASLNARQKESYNFYRIAAILSRYGMDCARLGNDWVGPDFLAIPKDNTFCALRVQLKGRLTINKKYIGKNLWVAWPFDDQSDSPFYLVRHRELVSILGKRGALNTKSWKELGIYNISRISRDLANQLKDSLVSG